MPTHNILRVLHIVGGVVWVGFTVFVATMLLPALRAIGPTGGAVMREVTAVRRLPVWLMIASMLTIVTGAALMYRDAASMGTAWFKAGSGLVFTVGAALAIAASTLGMIVSSPTAKRMGQLSAQIAASGRAPSDDERQRLAGMQARLFAASRVAAALLLAATIAMAGARYV